MNSTLSIDIDTAATKALTPGEYTIKVTAGALSASGTFTVVSAADDVELVVEPMEPSVVGEELTATATVTDAEGNPVADGTVVTFRASDLTGDADAVLVADETSDATKGGEASVTLIAVGPGRAAIRAVVSDDATPERATVVVTSTAGAPEVVEPEPVDCSAVGTEGLSATNGFATWSHDDCGTSASALFESLSGRGASAIHLWNGSAWVRYSVVDGEEVPGSSDFDVMDGDIVYISN